MKKNLKKITTFLIINFTLSSIFYYLIIKSGISIMLNVGLMWVPALSSIITQLIFNKNIKGFGWKFGKKKYLVVSLIIPFVTCLIVYGIVWITGMGGVSIDRLTEVFHKPINTVMIIIPTILFLFNLIAALGEEIGWRGFLASELLKDYSYIKTSLIISVIWFVWHLPLIIFSNYHANSTPIWYNILMAFICITGFTLITVWIKMKSGSLWTATIFHASHNLFPQMFFDVITIDYGKTKYVTTEFGVGIALVYIIIAIHYLRKNRTLSYS